MDPVTNTKVRIPINTEFSGGRLIYFNGRLEITKGFVHDLIELSPSDFKIAHRDDVDDYKFTLVYCGKETRKCGQSDIPVVVCEMVLMDRNMCLVHAVTNSGIAGKSHNMKKKLLPGSTVTLTDFIPIWHEGDGLCDKKVSLLLNDVEVSYPPCGTIGDECNEVHWKQFHIDRVPINRCHREQLIVHLEPKVLESMMTVWKMADNNMIHRTGSFIVDEEARAEHVRSVRRRIREGEDSSVDSNRENSQCECVTRFCLKQCCLLVKPLNAVDQDSLHDEVLPRVEGKVYADAFDGLVHRHKRWAYFYFCCVNILHSTSVCGPRRKRVALPSCLLGAVRLQFPPPKGEGFTGFAPNGDVHTI